MLALCFVAAADGGGALTLTVKLRVFVRRLPGATTAVIRTDPVLEGWKIATEEPALSVVSFTVGTPAGTTAAVDFVDLVIVLEVELVVVLFDELVGCDVAMKRPPLEAFQSTLAPARGEPSSARLTEMTELWFTKICAGPPVIVSVLG